METRSLNGGATPHQDSLSRFVEKVFFPLEVENASHNYRSQCRRAVKEFSTFLGRPALLSDLTTERVHKFGRWLGANAPSSQPWTVRRRIKSVWRYAAMLGLADPVSRYKHPGIDGNPVMTPGTLSHFFETVYLPNRLVGATDHCVKDYRRKIRQFDKFAGRNVLVEELSDVLLSSFLRHQLKAGLNPITVNSSRAHLCALWRHAIENGNLDANPGVRKLPEAYDEPDAWTEDEFRAILAACQGLSDRPPYHGVPAAALMRAVLLLAYWTGLRRGTLWKLRWADVDLENHWVTASGDQMKGKRGKRFRIGADAVAALRAIGAGDRETVLPPVYKRFRHEFDWILEASGVPASRRKRMSKFHKVRRTTATMVAIRQGVGAAAALLGHSSEHVTLRYIDPTQIPGNDMTNVLPTLSNLSTDLEEEGGAA